jgi:hypothetical protein
MLQGVSRTARKRHNKATPKFLQGVTVRAQQCRELSTLKGSMSRAQKCHIRIDPASFIWCQLRIAAMPIEQRTKGRVNMTTHKCHIIRTLPNQFNGVIVKTQKCRDIVAPRGEVNHPAQKCQTETSSPQPVTGDTDMTQQCLDHNSPRERSYSARRNAIFGSPLPTSLTGAIMTTQKRQNPNTPRERPTHKCSNAKAKAPLSSNHRGPSKNRRDAIMSPPPPNLGHRHAAEVPLIERPITRGHPLGSART